MPIYFMQAPNGLIKIGCSRDEKSLKHRLRSVSAASPVPLTLLGVAFGSFDGWTHKRFVHLRHHGEWFNPGQDLLDYIREVSESSEFSPMSKRPCIALTLSGLPCSRETSTGDFCTIHARKVARIQQEGIYL